MLNGAVRCALCAVERLKISENGECAAFEYIENSVAEDRRPYALAGPLVRLHYGSC